MLDLIWTSIRALFGSLGLGLRPEDLASSESDLGKTIDPNG